MLVEIHMIQNHAPSNLNRDDTGSPKDCLFGGTLRARISSQCLKRSIRQSALFRESLAGHLGTRTRRLPQQIKDELLGLDCGEADAALIARKATRFGSDKESEDLTTRQLIFLDPDEVAALARALKVIFDAEGPKKFQELKLEELEGKLKIALPRSVDIALFGRMTTSKTFEDVDASLQVAHAFSTHKLEKQFDYFTAVDDLVQEADEKGAGMIGDVEFNSATYYKYFSLDWDGFAANLGGDVEIAAVALDALLRAAALTSPTGKQNTFAAFNPPDAILVEVKGKKIPVSYANAFVKPVRAQAGDDVVAVSIAAISEYRQQLYATYPLPTKAALYLTVRGEAIADAQKVANLDDLAAALAKAVAGGELAGVTP